MNSVTIGLDELRIFLHVLSACVWVGGQIVMGALVPELRKAGVEGLTAKAARRFAQLSWPFFGVLVLTGIWNMVEMPDDPESSYQITLAIKLLLVAVAGFGAGVHSTTPNPAVRAMTAAFALLASVGAVFCGVLLVV